MKKLLAAILSLMLILSFAACSDNSNETKETNSKKPGTSDNVKNDKNQNSDGESDSSAEIADDKILNNEEKPQEEKAEPQPQDKPQSEPQQQPQQQPEQKPETTTKPEDVAPKTVGNILLADFKAKAASSNALSLAESLVANPVMADIMAGAMEVEPGFLTGFDNNEITGFKNGAVFMPMIGTIPFVGYVFELEDGVSASSFISNLKSSANLRWNICTTADEMVSGSVGNKVFFVMCPTSFDQE